MDYLTGNIAENLKRMRKAKGMSLDQLAEQTGVSKSMLAQIEKGTANPSIGVLGKITSGLRIPFEQLIAEPKMEYCLVNPDELLPTKEQEGQYRVLTCFPYEDSRYAEIYRIDLEPGGVYISGGHGEQTREYIAVTEGIMTIESSGHVQEVPQGHVYRFETDDTHVYRNNTDERTSCMCFFLDDRRS